MLQQGLAALASYDLTLFWKTNILLATMGVFEK